MEEVSGTGPSNKGTTPPPPPPPKQNKPSSTPGNVNLDIGGWLSKGFSEVFSDVGNYILLGIVVGIVSGITFGILAGPLIGGALVVVRRKLRGQGQIDVGQVFSIGFEKFLPAFVLVFVPAVALGIVEAILGVIPILGAILAFIISLAAIGFLGPFFAIGLHYIMEENVDFMDAGKKALDIIMNNIMMFWLFGLITGIVTGIGSIVCGVGVIVTIPVGLVMMSLMLETLFPKR
ncbi:MAG: hypothetical protein NTY09_06815 [bacterium]|nr:hypothetical protein [bacterium]